MKVEVVSELRTIATSAAKGLLKRNYPTLKALATS
jgi:hypothetical protein